MRQEIERLIQNYSVLQKIGVEIEKAVDTLIQVYQLGGKLMACGNGGSAADCEHIVGELLKEFKIRRQLPDEVKKSLMEVGASEEYIANVYGALPAISLASHVGFITAFNNDANSEYVFAQQVYALGKHGDALVAISTSGNSINVVNAAIMAKVQGIKVIALTGRSGGKLKEYADVLINVPSDDTARIQEYHLPVYHVICEALEAHFFA